MEENSNGSIYGKFVFILNKMKVCLINLIGFKSLLDVVMKWNCVINFYFYYCVYYSIEL